MDQKPSFFGLFFRLSRPYLLIPSTLLAFLGAGIARFLNHSVDWTSFSLGLMYVITVQLASLYLHEYFDLTVEADPESHTRFFGGSEVVGSGEGKLPRRTALLAGTASSMLAVGFMIILLWYTSIGIAAALLLLLIFISGLAFSVPPLRLMRSGYGELIAALFFGILVPGLSFSLQAGEVHRLIMMAGLPLVLLLVPAFLALSFPNYAADKINQRANMLQKIGWENSLVVHNTLILLAFLSLAGAVLLGFPRSIGMRVIATLPLGLLQIWVMGRLAAGKKPAWTAIRLNAVSMTILVMVILTISFWS